MSSSALLGEMADELRLRGYSPNTRKVYLGHVRRFLEYASHRPGTKSAAISGSRSPASTHGPPASRNHGPLLEAARRFLLELLGPRRASHSYVNQAVSALKFLFRHVLEYEGPQVKLPRPTVERKLPVVLAREEVVRILDALHNKKHRSILMLVYSSGLRVGEVVRLRVRDIDSERMLVHVRQGKGRKDRYVMLSDLALEALRGYWKQERPREWLFRGARRGRHLTERSVQKVFHRARRKAGIRKKVSVHSLRHAFATHLLESGTDVRFIQELLGHQSTRTTEIYTRVTRRSIRAFQSPLDQVWDGEREKRSGGGGREGGGR